MLERHDIERYERNAKQILSAIDRGRVPVDWATRAGTDPGDRAGADPD